MQGSFASRPLEDLLNTQDPRHILEELLTWGPQRLSEVTGYALTLLARTEPDCIYSVAAFCAGVFVSQPGCEAMRTFGFALGHGMQQAVLSTLCDYPHPTRLKLETEKMRMIVHGHAKSGSGRWVYTDTAPLVVSFGKGTTLKHRTHPAVAINTHGVPRHLRDQIEAVRNPATHLAHLPIGGSHGVPAALIHEHCHAAGVTPKYARTRT